MKQFLIPPTFDPAYSLLGRWLRHRTHALQAEARYYLYAVVGFVALVLVSFVAWALVGGAISADPGGAPAFAFFAGEVLFLVVFVATCFVGRRPAASVSVSRWAIVAVQGGRRASPRFRDIVGVEAVSELTFHRHYRRYERVMEFAGRRSERYLLIKTNDAVIAIGMESAQVDELLRLVQRGTEELAPQMRIDA